MTSLRSLLFGLLALAGGYAHSQPQLNCPVDWDTMTNLAGTGPGGLDVVVLGLRVRDWKPEYLDQALRRHDECQTAAGKPASLVQAERRFAQERADMLKGYLRTRDGRLAQEGAARQAQSVASQTGSSNIRVDPQSGRLTLTYVTPSLNPAIPNDPQEMTCEGIVRNAQALRFFGAQFQEDLPKFYESCVKVRQLSAVEAASAARVVQTSQHDRRVQAEVLAAVEALARSPSTQTHASVGALEQRWEYSVNTEADVRAAGRKLAAMREAVDARECPAHARAAGLPNELVAGWYLIEANTPAPMQAMACQAARNGARFKYRSGGVFGSESFEIKGRRSVEVSFARQKMPDGTVIAVPVKAKINGHTMTVQRANIQLLAHEIRASVNGE
jgi:hypothetical protein